MANRQRNIQLKIWVNEEERKLIEQKMTQLPTSQLGAYMRKMAIDGYIIYTDIKNIKQYIIYDVVVPVIKNTLSQIITGATDMIFFGEVRSTKSSWGVRGGSTKISYKDYWEGGSRSRQNNRDYRPSNRVSYDELYFESREDAANVLESMDDIVEQYGVVTVADLFDLAGVSGNGYTDQNYGWTSTNSADIFRDRDGAYRIKLLRPSPIK